MAIAEDRTGSTAAPRWWRTRRVSYRHSRAEALGGGFVTPARRRRRPSRGTDGRGRGRLAAGVAEAIERALALLAAHAPLEDADAAMRAEIPVRIREVEGALTAWADLLGQV